jgi:hypothetical protein
MEDKEALGLSPQSETLICALAVTIKIKSRDLQTMAAGILEGFGVIGPRGAVQFVLLPWSSEARWAVPATAWRADAALFFRYLHGALDMINDARVCALGRGSV